MKFLEGYSDGSKKIELKNYFEKSVKLAELYHENFVPIIEVKNSCECKWYPNGIIHYNPNKDVGTLFHEVFHSAFHNSEFNKGSNHRWGEAFCEAFRYYTEEELKCKNVWHDKITNYTSMTYDEVINQSEDCGHDKKLGYPASLIIKEVSKSGLTLLEKWNQLTLDLNINSFELDDLFKYSMKDGKPL
jgi:hypothetical protein